MARRRRTPRDVIDQRARRWRQPRAPEPADLEEVGALHLDLRSQLDLSELGPLDVEQLRAAAKALRPEAGRGVDQMTPLDFERLPDRALEQLVSPLQAVEICGPWP